MPITSDDILVFDSHIVVKFHRSLKAVSLVQATYTVLTNAATPVNGAFDAINLVNDYDSISRTLTLYYASSIQSNTTYTLKIDGLVDAAGFAQPTMTYTFVTNTTPAINGPIPAEPIYVEDHSIRRDAFTSVQTITEANPNFYISATDPDLETPILDSGYNNGRIVIKFSSSPSANYLTSQYFKVQNKILQRGLSRWNLVDGIIISMDSQNPWVYLDIPSQDATPVYNTLGSIYFLDGYKYRIKISKDVALG